jgi:outer membrane protein assembly factor BamB
VPGRGGLLAFNLKDGAKRWWVPGLSPEANTSPTLGDGLLYVASHLPGGDPDLRMKLPDFADLLGKYDKNKDGRLSQQEAPTDLLIFTRGGKDGTGEIRLHQMYWLFDKNGDGHIDRQEWTMMTTTPFNNSLLAIRPGGLGDISKSHVAWQARRGVPEVPSPLFYQGRIYMVRNGGLLTCLDARSGKDLFGQKRLGPEGMFYASPVAGDGKVYIASDSGNVVVLKAGASFEVLADNDLGESIAATPALVDGKIYVRTAGHLYAFAE